jgi:carbon storage regulator CsrA
MGYLVLSRKIGESLEIGDGITVTVSRISGKGVVKLAIQARSEFRIRRSETPRDDDRGSRKSVDKTESD